MAKTIESRDRTDLGNEWAAAVADLDEARETLKRAEERERKAWGALQQSRRMSVSGDDE